MLLQATTFISLVAIAPTALADDSSTSAPPGAVNPPVSPAQSSTPLPLPSMKVPAALSGNKEELDNTPLKDIMGNVELTVEPQEMIIKSKHGFRIRVKNNSDRAIVFDGEHANANIGGKVISCMDVVDFDEMFDKPETFASSWRIGATSTLTDGLTIGTWQTVGDMLKTQNFFKRYGKDEQRREHSEERFNQRVLWPGDTSAGIILFPSNESLRGATISLPVSSFFNPKDQAVVTSAPPAR